MGLTGFRMMLLHEGGILQFVPATGEAPKEKARGEGSGRFYCQEGVPLIALVNEVTHECSC